MFDTWIKEIATRHGIGEAADALAATLLSIIFDQRHGGIAGLISRFHRRIGGDTVPAWVGNANAIGISADIIKEVIGHDALNELDQQFGTAAGTMASIAAAELPALIGRLTPERRLPVRMPAAIAEWLVQYENARAAAPRRRVGAGRHMPWMQWGLLFGATTMLGYFVV